MTTFALATIERLGAESPASMVATNPYMLYELAEYMTPMTERIVAFGLRPKMTQVWKLLYDGSWKPGQQGPMQLATFYVPIGSRVYAIDWAATPAMAAYDYIADEWQELQPPPGRVTAAFVIDGVLHIFATDLVSSWHAVYEPAPNKWTELAPVRNNPAFVKILPIGQDVYVVQRSRVRNVWSVAVSKFDFGKGSPAAAHCGPECPKRDLAAVVVRGQIYVFAAGSTVGIYNPVTDAWSTTDVLVPEWWDSSARVAAFVYSATIPRWRCEIFDTVIGRWNPGPKPPPGIDVDMSIVALGLDVPFKEDPRRMATQM
ncbi:MAG: hypothetical protein M0R22_10960 [Dehalococcoidia bacterium]|nr:hypothetical protein [Dehalococcoidia bacterium]